MSDKAPLAAQEETRPYWEGVAHGSLTIPFDSKTGEAVWPPTGLDLVWRKVDGRGRVAAFSIVHRSPSSSNPNPEPYIIAFVTLDEGPRLLTRLVDVEPSKVSLAMRVAVRMEAVEPDGLLLPVFYPLEATGARA